MKKQAILKFSFGFLLAASTFLLDVTLDTRFLINNAEGVVFRPATPVSVAGVARRTTRRTVRRTSVYVASLPKGCTTVIVEGTKLQQCGTTYYQASGDQYVVVDVK